MLNIMNTLFRTILFLQSLLLISCGFEGDGINHLASGLSEARIYVVNSQVTAPTSYTVTVYNESGKLLATLADYTRIGAPIRGITAVDPFNFLISLENIDRIDHLSALGKTSTFAVDALFNGTIYDLERSPQGDVYVIETNTIEKFNSQGVRVGITATPYINTTIGACVLNTPRQMAFNADTGALLVTNTGNDRINIYNVSSPTSATCSSTNTSGGANDPVPILAHTDGNFYVGNYLTANSQIVRYNSTVVGAPTTVFATNASVILNPTALAELSDGSILVASDGTDAIVRISTTGVVLDNPFIKNTYTGSVTDILVVPGQ